MYGRILPQRDRVMSTMLPMTGSLIASASFATVMIAVTTTVPSTLMCAYCSKYTRMNVVTVVRTMFWPNPATTMDVRCARGLRTRPVGVVIAPDSMVPGCVTFGFPA